MFPSAIILFPSYHQQMMKSPDYDEKKSDLKRIKIIIQNNIFHLVFGYKICSLNYRFVFSPFWCF
jgi:hypothetical protein